MQNWACARHAGAARTLSGLKGYVITIWRIKKHFCVNTLQIITVSEPSTKWCTSSAFELLSKIFKYLQWSLVRTSYWIMAMLSSTYLGTDDALVDEVFA